MNIICGDIEKQVPLKGTYNIIEINPNCKIITKDFKIDEIKDREDLELHAEPFRVVSFPALDNPSYLDFKEKRGSITLGFFDGKLKSILNISMVILEVIRVFSFQSHHQSKFYRIYSF